MPPKQHDLSEVPEWARPIVEDYLARQAAERAAAEPDEATAKGTGAPSNAHPGPVAKIGNDPGPKGARGP
jgi:hypothetical protein